jgi:release factor glutamine methyltransferase
VTATLPDAPNALFRPLTPAPDVYRPQADSRLLVDTLESTTVVVGRRVVDLCTGSGIVAIAAAGLGAKSVAAWDISEDAVHCARRNATGAGVAVDVRLGTFSDALAHGPYDVVVANPPYVPTPATGDLPMPDDADPPWSWDGGEDGRAVVDPLCALAPELLADGGTMLLVQSEFTGVDQTVNALRNVGLTADVVAWQIIPFGPVLSARADWLEKTGRLPIGRRDEELVVIRADKR